MNPSPLPEPAQPHIVVPAGQPALGQQHPNFVYINGRPYHVTQQPQPQVVTVQLPAAQTSMHQWLRDMIVVTTLVPAVVAVCTAGICAAAVACGSTLIGIIGANLPFIGVTLVGLVLDGGWAATKFKAVKGGSKE
ncbi:hypothetical protein ABZ746_30335 [Streptomyces sp. NPDC020096]